MDLGIISQLKEFLQNNNSVVVIQNTVLFLILYGLEELLEKHIPCPCSTEANFIYAWMFFLFPSLILLMMSLLLHFELHQCYWCCRCGSTAKKRTPGQGPAEMDMEDPEKTPEKEPEKGHQCDITPVISFFRILMAPVLWLSILFLDGDYYTCAEIMKDEKVKNTTCAEFNCKGDPHHFISGQQRHCDKSRLIGGNLIFTFLALLLLLYFIRYCATCKMKKALCENESNSMHGNKSHGSKIEFGSRQRNGEAKVTKDKCISETDTCLPEHQKTSQSWPSSNTAPKEELTLSSREHKEPAVSHKDSSL
ncbi:calcium homeostasis modulator protein 5-like [Scyliorhinus canicula]|uniref:calcium homeostasis modulator protein 5-like n=1 Tax=Scyliorhinus canicula TaxID=7830 RepID=UPI0018F4EBA7|nr:calcium homeostasis modulator protein 5-like [Scyliorhinus canicula]